MTADVVVVGAGPAGAATATHLARRGYAVRLLDRSRFPRDKPCGEFLSPAATPLLEELGARAAVEAAGARRISRIRIVVHGSPPLDLSFPADAGAPPWGYALSRRRLDTALVDAARAAGVEVVEGVKVETALFEGCRVVGVRARTDAGEPWECRARLVVGAGGRNCPVARALALQRRSRRRRYDLLARWGSPAPEEPTDEGVCDLRVEGNAYAAAAPLEGGRRNVNVVVGREDLRGSPDVSAAYARLVERLLAGTGWSSGAPDEAVQASDVTALRTTRRTADGALLVGDSALFLDPFTGQGVYLALRGALLAARAAGRALAAGDTAVRALSAYDSSCEAEFRDKARVSRALQAVLFRPPLARRIAGAFRRDERLAGILAAVTGDVVPAGRAWSPAFGLRLARRAVL